jgi:peptidoglycan L-alanyl-D-glutamate endopeptidase CwlK
MPFLKQGDSGPKVLELQQRLKQLGFSPGKLDGDFRPGTEAAVMAFQRSEGLLVDGAVGPRTLKQLGLAGDAVMPSVIPEVTVAAVSRMFPFAPRDNIKTHLPNVLESLVSAELAQRSMVLVALSTIRAETAAFAPINEFQSRFNTSPGGPPFDLYDNMKALGKVASQLLARFMKSKERPIKEALLDRNLRAIRRLVNGGSHGLDSFTEAFTIGETVLPPEG